MLGLQAYIAMFNFSCKCPGLENSDPDAYITPYLLRALSSSKLYYLSYWKFFQKLGLLTPTMQKAEVEEGNSRSAWVTQHDPVKRRKQTGVGWRVGWEWVEGR